ncbi:hypothetical protein [Mycobacterium sp.]|uniref:hypothetical protein n=1 Tax=Mycobacterium sp. TaxID=1785 RepID=UPI003F9AA8FB
MSTPPGMIVNAQGITGEGVEFSLINETDREIVVTLLLVPVPPTPQLVNETWPSFTVLPTSLPCNTNGVDPNLVQFLYLTPQGVYNAFVQVDSGLYEVGADVVVNATGRVVGHPLYASPSGHHILPDRPDVDADVMR